MDSIATLPKVDLHCHLDGSLTLEFVQHTLLARGETHSKQELLSKLRCPDSCGSLAEYLERFELPIHCMQSADEVANSAYTFIESLVSDNVIYAEARFSPDLLVTEKLNQRQALEAVLAGLADAQRDFGIFSNVIVCAMRHQTAEQNLAAFKLASEYKDRGVCAVDLAGDEAAYPNKNFTELFAEAKRLGLRYTIHAGECGNAENIQQAVELGASRIGHGIAMAGNIELQKLCVEKQIGVEMCPVSNFQTKAVTNRAQYPIREFIDNGVLVTVNTDNRMVSNTSLAREFALLHDEYNFSISELNQLTPNAILCSFASDELKAKLLKLSETGKEDNHAYTT